MAPDLAGDCDVASTETVPKVSAMQPETATSMAPNLAGDCDVASTETVPKVSAMQPETATSMAPNLAGDCDVASTRDGPEGVRDAAGDRDLDGTKPGR
jgi:hypothetical protein